ncbi:MULTISPECIES: DUF1418 family protein [Cedecea]|jgi:hypothetical protein|uniref:DUF1418 family protein n=1 Tax=Cedecea TaxID=158483 RepID=UPI0011855403|nr:MULTISPECIES: DUF1418 family protein [Cedecea]NWC63918.1 DUF1418 family protein [Cedecea sp. P7760]
MPVGYLTLPAPIASATAAIVMVFIGPGPMQPDSASKHSDLKKPKENSDDADH